MYTPKQRAYYNAQRAQTCDRIGITQNQYNAFRRIGAQLHHLYEESCNGTIDEQAYEDQTNVWYAKADTMAKKLHLFIYYQTDPRGATIYLDTKEIPEDKYTSAYCIY